MSFIKKYLLGISILVIGISGFFLYGSLVEYYPYPFQGMGRTTGKAIGYASMAFFVANSLRKRWEIRRLVFWIFCFAVSFFLCATYDSVKTNKKTAQLNNSKQELARLAQDFSDKKTPPKSSNTYSVEEYGDFSNLLPLIKHCLEVSDNMTIEINEACANLEGLLTSANLCEYDKILEGKERVAIFADKLDHFKKRYAEELIFNESELIKAFAGNEYLKKQALKGFEEGKEKSNKLMKEYFSVEETSIEKMNNILDFVDIKLGTFWEEEDMLIFQNDADADMFNQLVQDLMEHVQKEDIIIQKLERHRLSLFQQMENFDD